jgi:cobalt/nickel transport system permease protein
VTADAGASQYEADPVINILSFTALAASSATAPRGAYVELLVIGAFVLFATSARGVSIPAVLKKSLVVIPFVLMAFAFAPFMVAPQDGYYEITGPARVSKEGVTFLLNASARSWTAALCLVALTESTPFNRLLEGLARLRLPSSFVATTAFAHRYAFALSGDASRMRTAMESRMYGARWLWRGGAVGGLTGALFLRSLDRAERVQQAALSRGFDGSFHGPEREKTSVANLLFLAVSLALSSMPRLAA